MYETQQTTEPTTGVLANGVLPSYESSATGIGIVERAHSAAEAARRLISELVSDKARIYSDAEVKVAEIDKALAELGHVAKPATIQPSGELKYCKVCKDNVGHDARNHRGQDKPRAFTPSELDELNQRIATKRAA